MLILCKKKQQHKNKTKQKKKMLTSSNLRESWCQKVYFLKLHICDLDYNGLCHVIVKLKAIAFGFFISKYRVHSILSRLIECYSPIQNMLTCIYNQNWQKFRTRRKVGLSMEGSVADFYSVSHHYCQIFISERETGHSA